MASFCLRHGIPEELVDGATKPILWQHCKNIMKEEPQFEIDALAEEKKIRLLQLPPYHPDLNPIEMIWGAIKNKVRRLNTSFKVQDVLALTQQAYDSISAEDWKKRIEHTIRIEDEFARIDGIDDHPLHAESFMVMTPPDYEIVEEEDEILDNDAEMEDEDVGVHDQVADDQAQSDEDEDDVPSPSHYKVPIDLPIGMDQDENNNSKEIPIPSSTQTICKVCNKICKTKTALIQHEKSHENSSKMCHLCGKMFYTNSSKSAGAILSNHTKVCKGGPAETKCLKCGKDFKRPRNLKRHKLVCSPSCNQCGKTFLTMKGLGLHLCPKAPMLL